MFQCEQMNKIFKNYGETAVIDGNTVRAIIRPLQFKSGAVLNLPTECYDNLHYLYTGPIKEKLNIGQNLKTKTRDYIVKRSDTTEIGGKEIYVWAVLKALAVDADRKVYLEFNKEKIADIDSYSVKCIQQSRTVNAWGEQNAIGTVPGRIGYELKLKNVRPYEGIDLCTIADFNLTAVRPKEKVTYLGCRWKNIESVGGAGNTACRLMELVASERIQGAEKNGQ